MKSLSPGKYTPQKSPVISAVGHERDVTISDLVADQRAATPSVAAEIVIPCMEDLREQVEGLSLRMTNAFESLFPYLHGVTKM